MCGAITSITIPAGMCGKEVEALRDCTRRRRPYGDEAWMERTAREMGLEASLRPRGRPRKKAGPLAGLFSEDVGED